MPSFRSRYIHTYKQHRVADAASGQASKSLYRPIICRRLTLRPDISPRASRCYHYCWDALAWRCASAAPRRRADFRRARPFAEGTPNTIAAQYLPPIFRAGFRRLFAAFLDDAAGFAA